MKIAFSTLGCPDWSFDEIYTMARDLGYDGIEIRGLGQEMSVYRSGPFQPDRLASSKARLEAGGLAIPCLSSSCCLCDADEFPLLEEARAYLDLAASLGVPYVRVLADRSPAPEGEVDDALVLSRLARILPLAEAAGIVLLLETNGAYADSTRLRRLLDAADHPAVGVLWDIHHPFRFFGESPADTYAALAPFIRHVHLKDSVVENGIVRYRLTGEGDVPVREALLVLARNRFDGFVSLEWVKRWSRDLSDAAVVFPHFIDLVRRWLGEAELACHFRPYEGFPETLPPDTPELLDLTIGDMLLRMARHFPNQPCVTYPDRPFRLTYAQFREEVDLIARGFLAMGIRKGDHVAIWATNHPEWLLTLFATARIGAVLVTVNTSYKAVELEYVLRQSDAMTLVLMDGYKDVDAIAILNEVCPELQASEPGRLQARRLPCLRHVVSIGKRRKPGMFAWEDLRELAAGVQPEELDRIARTLDPHDVINMQYTSGTTGFPKGVMLTHFNILNNGRAIGDCMALSQADRLLIPVPFFHCFGLVLAVLACLTHAATMVPLEYFQPGKALEAIRKERCTAMHGVPTMFIAVLEHPDFERTDFSSLRTGIMAGSPCPIKVMREVVERMHMGEITIAYGQTEASPVCTQTRVHDSLDLRVSTVGRALPGIECRIADPATREVLPPGVPGEFTVRGYNVMKGYYKMPEATSAAIDGQGFLHTGDLAVMDENGYFRITGRIKDMIIRGGENIYPKEIEEYLYTHPAVKDVQCVGVPDRTYGEEILAAVILREGHSATEDEIRDYVRSRMARHKTPRYVRFVESFPMTASGKIQKYRIREWAIEALQLEEAARIETA